MKKVKILAVLLIIVFSAFSVNAQKTKIGVVNIGEILVLMPRYDSLQVAYQSKYTSIQRDLQTMVAEYQRKAQELEQTRAQNTDIINSALEEGLIDMKNRIERIQQGAPAELDAFEKSQIEPLLDEIRTAIKDVAKEHGFTHIINNSQEQVLYYEDSSDILPLVKKKMNLKDKSMPSLGQ
ncbi:MAG: OmpH family outer membrane protein [Bacteroidales bacterium]|nr:OmpH family outer membrane protein [Bacteroidales bacterium]